MQDLSGNGEENEGGMTPRWLLILLFAGFAVLFAGILIVFAATASGGSGSSSTGVVIFIGPFPIVFGSGPNAGLLILIGVIIAVVSLLSFIVLQKKIVWENV